jgi:thiol-disulfide isomerase/thioredoxin
MRAFRLTLAALPLVLLALLPAPTRAEDVKPSGLPRYQFPVGRKLTWTWSGESKSADGKTDSKSSSVTELTVVRANPDGSSRVLVRYIPTKTKDAKDGADDDGNFRYADVFPDGRFLPNDSFNVMSDISGTIPLLPADAGQASKGWRASRPESQEERMYTPQPAKDPNEYVFTADVGGMLKKVYLIDRTYTFHFDRARGVITADESAYSQGHGFHVKGTSASKLTSDETLGAADAAALAADLDRLIETKRDYGRKMDDLEKAPPDKADALDAAALDVLKRGRAALKTEVVRGELDRLLKRHEAYAKEARESATEFTDILNKPSPDWATTDIDGKPVKLADLRGEVVVMDFWYRGCVFCMFAMPQVKQLAEDYQGKPVVMLSMNTDLKDEDARFVVEAFGLRHPTIKARGINDKYGIYGFPNMVVIDPAGVVRDVHIGYSKTLRADVGKKIDEALAKSQ